MRTSLLFAILVLALTVAQSGTGAAQGGAPQAAGDPANGKAVFAFGNTSCTNCHGLEGQGGWGPDLAGRTDHLRPGHCGHPESHLEDARVRALSAERQGNPGHGRLLEHPARGSGDREVEERGARGRPTRPAAGGEHHRMRAVPRCHDEHAAPRRRRDERGLRVVQEAGLQPRDGDAGTVEAARWRRASDDARPRADGQFLAETIARIAAPGNLDMDERFGNGGARRGATHQRGQRRRPGPPTRWTWRTRGSRTRAWPRRT